MPLLARAQLIRCALFFLRAFGCRLLELVMGKNVRENSCRTAAWREMRQSMVIPTVAVLAVFALSSMTYSRNMLWQDSAALWQDTTIKSPKKFRPRFNLAKEYEARGDIDLAIENYRAAINLKPDDVMAHNNLGNAYLNQGRLGEAIEEFHVAVRLKPEAPLTHDNLGYVYFKQGRPDEAIKEYKTALKFAPGIAEIHNNLGYVYFTTGRFDDAAEEFRTALELKPDFPAALDNMKMLHQARNRKPRRE
ncbi:MAG TPA: tetratricopeptide repeat protein [Nitrospirota bacterium]|nr:tetratricopeptide repeat protein [Nitrospirota bacterium]